MSPLWLLIPPTLIAVLFAAMQVNLMIGARAYEKRRLKILAKENCQKGVHEPLQAGPVELVGLCIHCGHDTYADQVEALLRKMQ